MLNIIELNEGILEVYERGTEKELIEAWNTNKSDWIRWINENDSDLYKEAVSFEVEVLRDLKYLFDNILDLSWWRLKVVSDKELEELKEKESDI